LLSFDLSDIKNRYSIRNIFYRYLKDLDFREWAKLNIILNGINFIQISILSLISLFSSRRIVRSHLTRILDDTASLNEQLQRTIQNLIMNHSRFHRNTQNYLNTHQLIAFANTNTIINFHIQTLFSQANSLRRSIGNSTFIMNYITKILTILQLQIRYINLFFLQTQTHRINYYRDNRIEDRSNSPHLSSIQEETNHTSSTENEILNNQEIVHNAFSTFQEFRNRDDHNSNDNLQSDLNEN